MVEAIRKVFTFKLNKARQDRAFAIASLVPAFAILIFVVFWPIVKGIWMSFYEYTFQTMKNPVWNNFQNYTRLFESGEIFVYFKNTLIYVVFSVALELIIALIIALLLNTDIYKKNIYRGLFLVPWTVPSVVTALMWSWLFQSQYGVLNYIFYNLGLIEKANMQWTQSPRLAMATIIIATVWQQAPLMIVMILAALQSISKDLIEASEIDGANKLKVFSNVMIPSIRPVIDTVLIIGVTSSFQMFTLVYNITGGGPMDKTMTLALATHMKAFTQYDLGAGSAIGVMWLVALASITILYNSYAEKKRNLYM